jgi:hypothetical protein
MNRISLKPNIHMKKTYPLCQLLIASLLVPVIVAPTGCSTGAASGAAEGAAIGATTSALGTLVVGLIFNDRNVGERVARSAVYGATAGAVAGGVAGAARDEQIRQQAAARVAKQAEEVKQQQQMEEVQIREAVGTANFFALEALSNCKFEDAIKLAKESEGSSNKECREASLWIQGIAAVLTKSNPEIDRVYEELVKLDPELGKPEMADSALAEALAMLEEDRVARGLPPACE